jgi:hypothetical protein
MKEFIGIQWVEKHQRWQSSVRHDGTTYQCGMHVDQKLAVLARDTKIIEKGLPTKLQILKPIKK